MSRSRKAKSQRKRVGQVSYYFHHGNWHIYYRQGRQQVRRRVGDNEQIAAQVAAQINAQLSADAPTLFSFTPLSVADLRQKFLDHHEHVLRSSLATIRRYRAATQHLENFASTRPRGCSAHEVSADQFVHYLRTIRVAPNGHAHAALRALRDKGVRFILETCRSLYGFAAKKRHLPPYADNPFAGLGGKRSSIEDAKQVFVFDAESELAFFRSADPWSFAIHFTLAKTGIRPGELIHLLIEDLDLEKGWMQIRNKPELGWRIKTRRERAIPLVAELVGVLRCVIGDRKRGIVFLRERFGSRPNALANSGREALAKVVTKRIEMAESQYGAVLSRDARSSASSNSLRSRLLKLSTQPFCQGEPGSM